MTETSVTAACLCGALDATDQRLNGLPMLACTQCGVLRQRVHLDAYGLSQWYALSYFQGIYTHTDEQDEAVAEARVREYQRRGLVNSTDRLLDVGCGTGAFVDAAQRLLGCDAWGQDVASAGAGPRIYVGALDDVAFPTDHFTVVTVHDVLEHVPAPVAFLNELRRIVAPGGTLIIDFPHFFSADGKHHWKPIEHLWMLSMPEVNSLLNTAGFDVERVYSPIASKLVFVAKRRCEKRPQILTPAGIGDTLWVVAKLPGFIAAHADEWRARGITDHTPEVWIQDSGGPRRSVPFVQTLPLVHAAGYKLFSGNHPLFSEAYMCNGRTIYPNVLDVDYFMAYNGVMRHGTRLEDADAEYGVDWYPKMHVSKEAVAMRAAQQALGPYCVVYLVSAGMYGRWISEFPEAALREAILALEKTLGLRIVLVGAEWDIGSIGSRLAASEPRWSSLIGQTSYDQLLGVLSGAALVFGYPSGLSILGPVLRVPTVLCWNSYFHPAFWANACPPDARYYATLDTFQLKPDAVVTAAQTLLRQPAAT